MKVVKQTKNLQTKSGKFKKFFLINFLFLISFMFSFNSGETPVNAQSFGSDFSNTAYVYSVRDRGRMELINEVKLYMHQIAPDSKLDPEFLVLKCLEYDMDIAFVVAQGILESHLGTKGLAVQTNSVWNVGTYDNGEIKYRYSSVNESIEPYLKLLKDKYLINISVKGDTIYKDLNHLLQDRGYKNLKGERYATASSYENSLRKIMIQINMDTNIQMYQQVVTLSDEKILAYFGPIEKEIVPDLKEIAMN